MLTTSGLSKSFGSRVLFRDVDLTLAPGRRVALVGGNGSGKTTLLEILAGLQPADGGGVHRPNDLHVGYLPQELPETGPTTVLESVLGGVPQLAELEARLHDLESRLGVTAGPDHDRALLAYGEAQARFEHLGGYSIEAEAHRVLAGLGFSSGDAHRPLSELSGGWRVRTALGRLLLARPDILLLDEPTNHLDVDSVAWLERQFGGWPGGLLFVSHDRDFIDAVANRVVELAGGTTVEYVGGFAEFVAAREERIAQQEAAAANQARQVRQAERFIERFRYKATKARQVQSRIKALDKLDRIAEPDRRELKLRFGFPEPRRSSRVVAEAAGVDAGYDGRPVLREVDVVIERGQKVALVGPNGAGKTTLVKLLTGELEPLAGTVTLGANVDRAVFVQDQTAVLDLDRRVVEEFRTSFTDQPGRNIRTVLGSFGFPGDAADRRVGDLSGGERTRLALAKVMADPVNLLILDEPTNHLDLPSCDLLEDALGAYPGTVLLVTHDRHLIRSVADALIEVRDGRARWHEGVPDRVLTPGEGAAPSPSSSRSSAPDPSLDGSGREPTEPGPGARPSTQKAARKREEAERRNRSHRATKELRRRLARVEREWQRAEEEIADLQRQLADPAVYEHPDEVRALAARHDDAKDRADDLMTEWEAISTDLG